MIAASATSPRRWRWAGGAAVLVFAVLVLRFWHPVYGFTRFLQVDAVNDATNLPAFREQPIYLYRNTGGYDGQYYAQIAYDPTIRTPALRTAVDNLEYRARRILPAMTAYVLAGGRPAAIASVYAVLNPLAWLALAGLLWRILPVTDARSFAAWCGVLFSAGALAAVRYALTDLIAVALTAAALGWSATSGRALTPDRAQAGTRSEAKRARPSTPLRICETSRSTRSSSILLALAALARETAVLALPGLWTRPWFSRRNAIATAVAAAPMLLWLAYLRRQLGPSDPGLDNFAWPLVGWMEKVSGTIRAFGGPADLVLVGSTLLAVIGISLQAGYCLMLVVERVVPNALSRSEGTSSALGTTRSTDARPRWDDPWSRVGLVYSALLLCLGTAVWEGFPGAAFRVVLPLTLASNVIMVRRRSGWGWLIGANLGVFAGVLSMLQVPDDPGEIAAAHTPQRRLVAREVSGWYGTEHTSHHRWAWAGGDAVLQLRAWPRSSGSAHCTADLRALVGQTVTLSQGSRICWSGTVAAGKTSAAWDVKLVDGRATLAFHPQASAVEPTRSGAPGDPRALAFALYDLKMTDPDARPHTP